MRLGRSGDRVMLYILHSGNMYGTERMALATLEGMDNYHKRVVVAPLPAEGASVGKAALSNGFNFVAFNTRLTLLKALLPWFLKYRTIDVVGTGVVHSAVCHTLSRLLFVRLRQLHVAHGGTSESFDRKHVLNRFPLVVVAVSNFVRDALVQRGVRADSIQVIDNFLSKNQRDEAIARLPYNNTSDLLRYRPLDRAGLRVAVVSRVDTIKRIDVLLTAVERHGLKDFQFDIYGTGTDFDRLKERSRAFSNINFHGFVPDVKRRLSESDLLLHLCPVEPFGLAVLEAYVAGVVVIVPNEGGVADLVEDNVTGLKFAANDATDVARVLEQARNMSPADLQRLASTARGVLEQRFSQEAGLRHYHAALESAGELPRRHRARVDASK